MSISNIEHATPVELTHAHPSAVPLRRVRRRAASWAQLCLATDAAIFMTAVFVAWRTSAGSTPTAPIPWTIAFGLLVITFFYTRGMYRNPLQLRALDGSRAVITATALAAAVVVSVRVVLSDSPFVASQSTRLWLFATALLVAGRIVVSVSERRARRADDGGHSTLIVGAGKVGRLVAARLRQHPEIGLKPVAFIDEDAASSREKGLDLPILGTSWDIERIVEDEEIEHVVVTSSAASTPVLLRLMTRCEELGVRTSVVPRLYEKTTERFTVSCLGGVPLVSSLSPDPKGWQFAVKYAVDRVAAAVLLVLLTPLLAVLVAAVLISLGRPILFRQRRIGRDGRSFDMFKFRSMAPAVEQPKQTILLPADTAPGGVEGADRRTRVGKILRQTSLDELPQLLNVIRGEMSFIGPRPERPEFVDLFEQKVHRYCDRHRVKSGITGWAQVHGLRGKTSIADRVEWDNFYIENWSLWLDFKILLLTLGAVARPAAVE
jgi:exopolysaccharide biosynthesis polyprenyl glycosylphosphotransferase